MATRKPATKATKTATKTTKTATNSRVKGTIKRTLDTNKEIAFSFYAPLASKVQVAGTFNSWNGSKAPLKKNPEGHWNGTVKIRPGKYEYRFLIDGQWENDQQNMNCVPNQHGSSNCVLEVR